MRFTLLPLLCLSTLALLSACATPPRVAQPKAVEIGAKKLEFGGSYATNAQELTLTINGDPVMRGRFPPYTTRLNLKANYEQLAVSAQCSFGTVLSSTPGLTGKIVGAVQAATGRGGDKCDLSVEGKQVETLYF